PTRHASRSWPSAGTSAAQHTGYAWRWTVPGSSDPHRLEYDNSVRRGDNVFPVVAACSDLDRLFVAVDEHVTVERVPVDDLLAFRTGHPTQTVDIVVVGQYTLHGTRHGLVVEDPVRLGGTGAGR